MEFYLDANWSDNFTAIVPVDFDGKTLEAPRMTATPEKLTAIKAGEVIEVAINTNVAWTIASAENWITPSPALGTGTDTVDLTVAVNSGSSPRTSVITATAGNIVRTFTITQSGT
jgi:hypothetical protein